MATRGRKPRMKPEDDLPEPPDFSEGERTSFEEAPPVPAEDRDFTDTPEFRAAVAKAAAQAAVIMRDQILADLKASGIGAPAGPIEPASAPGIPQDRDFAGALAMAIAELTDQGRTKRLAPEVMRERLAARDLMHKLLMQAKASWRECMRIGDRE